MPHTREARDTREPRDARESREARDAREASEAREALREVVMRVEQAHPDMALQMRDLLATNIDTLQGDQQLLELLHASIESNLSTIFHMLINDIDLQSLKPPTAAIEYAVRLAQRDIPLASLTRAYYLAQSMFLRIAMDEVEQQDLSDGRRLELVRSLANVIHSYIDWMLQRITEEYGTEHRRWWSARATTNTASILKVLRGDTVSQQSFTAETHYDLDQRHLAMVAWFDDPSGGIEAQQRLDRLVRQVAALLGSPRAPLISAVDRTTAWAWASMPVARLPEKTRVSIDEVVDERALREIYLEGFRIAVAEGRPWLIMTSYNKVNGVWAHYNFELVTTILRGQWGYDGVVMTDWWMQPSADPDFDGNYNCGYRIRAQVDVLMPGGNRIGRYDRSASRSHKRGGVTLAELQRSARNVLSVALALKFI